MKKIISSYLIFVFMLMTFSGCERIKNSLGLGSSANDEIPANPKNPNRCEVQVIYDVDKSISPDTKIDIKGKAKIARTAAWITLAATGAAVIYSFYKLKKIEMPSRTEGPLYDPDKYYKAFMRIVYTAIVAVAINTPVLSTAVCLTHEANRNKKKIEP